ncbi:MAG TPA: molybdate ABC transporter substrate-binding protein [Usitatibacter sp.]|nr:molybdate ABC transporter substrate-binding protein [Usitatibacter sp.]
MSMACAMGVPAAESVKVLAGSAVQPAMNEIVPAFERSSGHSVTFDYGTVGGMAKRVAAGERADAAIVSGPQMRELAAAGRVLAGTACDLGKTGIGVFVRKGAAHPRIETPEAFRSAMFAAGSIGYNDPAAGAPVGIYLVQLFERMGIAGAMKAKTVVFKDRAERFGAVARGDVELGFNQVSEIVAQPSVELVGPLPGSLQNYTVLSAGVVASSERPEAAREFVRYICAPEALATLRGRGFEAP